MYIGDDSTTGKSANIQVFGGYIEENQYNLVVDGGENCSFYGTIIQHSSRGSEIVTTSRSIGTRFYNLYLESINGDTIDTYGFRSKPLIDIPDNSYGTSFYGIRFPQNPVIMGWRRMLRNSGDGTLVNGLRTTADTLVVNPVDSNDYAFIEQNSSAGDLSLEFETGQSTIGNPYIYVIDENGEFPNSRATVILQRQNGRRMSGLYNYYSDTGGDALLALYKTTGNTLLNSRLYFAIDGVHFGQSPDTTGANVRLYSDYAHRLRLEDGDTFFIDTDWNSGLFRLATWRMWEDSSGYLRGRGSGDPVSDKDGSEFFFGDSIRYDTDSLYIYINGKYGALQLKAIP
jgi:hypothetical protein